MNISGIHGKIKTFLLHKEYHKQMVLAWVDLPNDDDYIEIATHATAMDANGDLYAYSGKPQKAKQDGTWTTKGKGLIFFFGNLQKEIGKKGCERIWEDTLEKHYCDVDWDLKAMDVFKKKCEDRLKNQVVPKHKR